MSCFRKGEKVWVESPRSKGMSLAIFVQHDLSGFPKSDVILATRIGGPKSKIRMVHKFRWPIEYVHHYDEFDADEQKQLRKKSRKGSRRGL